MIAAQDLRQLLNQAELKLSGATLSGIKAEMYDVMTEFFDVSSCWTETIQYDALANQREFRVTPSEGQIIRLGGAVANTLFATNAAYEAVEDADPPTNQNIGTWSPVPAVMPYTDGSDDPNGTIYVTRPSSTPLAMRFIVIKNVVLPQDRNLNPIAPNWVLPRWHNVILDGILGKMMGTPSMTYSDPTTSVYHLRRFQEGIARARVAALKSNAFGAQAWTFPANWQTRTQRGYMNVSVGTDTRFK